MGTTENEPITGTAGGVPFLAIPPPAAAMPDAPLVVALHMMDPPRSEAAMAAALPMNEMPAWRVYLGLPMFGPRAPIGGPDEIMRLGYEDALMNLIAPVTEQAAEELPGAVSALREQLTVDESPIGLVGGSAGAAAVLLALAETDLPVAAAALVNPAIRASAVIAAGERLFGFPYPWNDERRARAERLDFVRRAADIAEREPRSPIILVVGEQDDSAFLEAADEMRDALLARVKRDEVSLVRIPDLAHALTEEPGIDAAPQSEQAAAVDAAVTGWLRRWLVPGG